MPRLSAEQRSAALWQAGIKAPPPPDDLEETAKRLWRDVAATKPADQWNAGTLQLLRGFCLLAVRRDQLDLILRNNQPCTPEYRNALGDLNKTITTLGVTAKLLRIGIQQQIDRRSGRITEKGLGEDSDEELFGGSAVWQPVEEPRPKARRKTRSVIN